MAGGTPEIPSSTKRDTATTAFRLPIQVFPASAPTRDPSTRRTADSYFDVIERRKESHDALHNNFARRSPPQNELLVIGEEFRTGEKPTATTGRQIPTVYVGEQTPGDFPRNAQRQGTAPGQEHDRGDRA